MKNDTSGTVDISAFMPEDKATIEVIAPNGVATGWFIDLAGPSHPKTIAFNEVSARKSLHRQRLVEQAQVNGKKYQPEDKSPDEVRRENASNLAARIISWTPIKIGAETFEFSEAAAQDLLIRPEMGWAYIQISEALAEEKRFMKRSATA